MKWFPFGKKNDNAPEESDQWIRNVTDADFDLQVIKRSYKMLVVVDFWASWCGPCRQLGPVLEKQAARSGGNFMLAKINTEQSQQMPQKYQIRSIPAVKMFRNGRIVGQFTGALPGPLVRKFINDALQADAPPQGFQGSDEPDKRLQQARHYLKKGNGFHAFYLLNEFPDGPQTEKAAALLPLARFMCDIADGDGLTELDALDKEYTGALKALQRSKPAKALQHLTVALEKGEEIDRRYTTEVMQALFALLGPGHQLTRKFQAQIAS